MFTIETLPFDVQHVIISSLSDIPSLLALISSSKALYSIFKLHKKSVLDAVYINEIEKDHISDALCRVMCLASLKEHNNKPDFDTKCRIVRELKSQHRSLQAESLSGDAVKAIIQRHRSSLAANHGAIRRMARIYADMKLRPAYVCLFDRIPGPKKVMSVDNRHAFTGYVHIPVTESELVRIRSAIYRFMIWGLSIRLLRSINHDITIEEEGPGIRTSDMRRKLQELEPLDFYFLFSQNYWETEFITTIGFELFEKLFAYMRSNQEWNRLTNQLLNRRNKLRGKHESKSLSCFQDMSLVTNIYM